jgi:hypothetical protein
MDAVVAAASWQFAIMRSAVFAVEFFVDDFEAHERTIEGFWHYINDSEPGWVDFFFKIWYNYQIKIKTKIYEKSFFPALFGRCGAASDGDLFRLCFLAKIGCN